MGNLYINHLVRVLQSWVDFAIASKCNDFGLTVVTLCMYITFVVCRIIKIPDLFLL